MAAYMRGLIQAFIRRFKRLLWLRGYLFGYSVKMPFWGVLRRSVAFCGALFGCLFCQLLGSVCRLSSGSMILCIDSPICLVGMSAILAF